jgi:hypothetical protein
VHQVHVRLTTSGLVAQLFDWQHAQKAAADDRELFRELAENDNSAAARKRVKFRCSALGGAEFVTEDVLGPASKEDEGVRPLQSRQTL